MKIRSHKIGPEVMPGPKSQHNLAKLTCYAGIMRAFNISNYIGIICNF